MKIENKEFTEYKLLLMDKHRVPSRGGNTMSTYRHALVIDGEEYSFLTRGSKQWAYKSDKVSFEFEINTKGYRNIKPNTFKAVDKHSNEVLRDGQAGIFSIHVKH